MCIRDSIQTPTPVVKASPINCNSAAAPNTYTGKIVICERGTIARVLKGYNVLQGGASGMILYNPALQGLSTDNHYLPSVHIEYPDGGTLLSFMDSHTGVMATFTPGTASTVQGDVMAAFSSRGGPAQSLGVSKPDITAPGVQILAGNTPVSYTHLRAHETVLDLVCRLLLEKKKTHLSVDDRLATYPLVHERTTPQYYDVSPSYYGFPPHTTS